MMKKKMLLLFPPFRFLCLEVKILFRCVLPSAETYKAAPESVRPGGFLRP